MIALYILGGILLLLILICLIRVKADLTFDSDIRADLRVLFLRIPLYPAKNKVKLSDYSYRKTKKRRAAAEEKAKKKAAEKQAAAERKAAREAAGTAKKVTFQDKISLYVDLFRAVYARFLRYFRMDLSRLHITVATGDAAQTAILTGVAAQGVAYICEILDQHTNLKANYRKDVSVQPDYLAEKSRVDCRIVFSIRVGQVLDLSLRLAYRYLSHKFLRHKPPEDAVAEPIQE